MIERCEDRASGDESIAMQGRRRFLTSMSAALAAAASPAWSAEVAEDSPQGLVPSLRSPAPNYWCTWAAQNYIYGQGAVALDASVLEGAAGAALARGSLREQVILGPQGWAETFHSRARGDLYLLLDDGWEEGGNASFQLDEQKFPSFPGAPQERLRGLNRAVRAAGWRSLAVWCRNPPGGYRDRQYVTWTKFAGIPYLKVDRGDLSGSLARARAPVKAPRSRSSTFIATIVSMVTGRSTAALAHSRGARHASRY